MPHIELLISGMTCEHCVRTVSGALAQVPGVLSAEVSLPRNLAQIETNSTAVDRNRLVEAVRQAGYDVPVEAQSVAPIPPPNLVQLDRESRTVVEERPVKFASSADHLLLDI